MLTRARDLPRGLRSVEIVLIARCLFFSVLLACVLSDRLNAEAPKSEGQLETLRVLFDEVSLQFEPQDAFFIYGRDAGTMRRVRGTVFPLPPNSGDETPSPASRSRTYLLGTVLPSGFEVPAGKAGASRRPGELRYAVVLLGANPVRDSAIIPVRSSAEELEHGGNASTELLRSTVLAKRKELKSWEVQLREQQESLRRLRADAEVIGDIGRILDLQDELDLTNARVKDTEKDIETLIGFIRLARSRPQPANFARREVQLQQQISLLADAVTKSERDEFRRKSSSEVRLQQQLKLIEDTRHEDLDLLQKKLDELRERKKQLVGGGSAGAKSEKSL